MKLNYKIYGNKPVGIVIEMGLGSCISEWIPFAKMIQDYKSVLIYERAGINRSEVSKEKRTPQHIAKELYVLLSSIEHEEKLIIVGHSQGGLYASEFCSLYPDMVDRLILIDPLSPTDNDFKEQLSEEEYKKSGVDKSFNFVIMKKFAGLKMSWIAKAMLKKAPPFYYYNGYSKEEMKDILGAVAKKAHADTVLQEYYVAHDKEELSKMCKAEDFPDLPLILVTHSSELAIDENMKFGNNTREFAVKIENMWQGIMKEYMRYTTKSRWVQATRSTHYIHLQEPEIIIDLIKE